MNLSLKNISTSSNDLEAYLQLRTGTLDRFAPQTKKQIPGNNMPLLNKSLESAHKIESVIEIVTLKKSVILIHWKEEFPILYSKLYLKV